ncbi:MAG: hypothetical protein A2Z14_19825 [Chloroflexi bacterium RBG_16_48_8]|nr:MAG: hypothetical protein A2Z14_19825 [Chloroflexi bacterium RBG_16_48_8]
MKAPSEWLEKWIGHITLGNALELGAGDGETTVWLAQSGFKVVAVERDPEACRLLREACMGLDVEIHPMDVRDHVLSEGKYNLIYASALLHFIKPTDLWPLADRIVAALASGGFLIAEAFTIDDPGYEALWNSGVAQIEPNTFVIPSSEEVIHYFAPGELRRTFSVLEVFDYEETRRIDAEDPVGYRSGAALVARKK